MHNNNSLVKHTSLSILKRQPQLTILNLRILSTPLTQNKNNKVIVHLQIRRMETTRLNNKVSNS